MQKLTIVIPIYNVEQYLIKCFDSLINQDNDQFVIHAINDGSPDNSLAIMQEYKQKYPNKFIITDKENGGYGSVLEYAIKNCTTSLFMICDPDDYLEVNAVNELLQIQGKFDSDVTIGAKNLVYSDNDEVEYDNSYNDIYVTLKNEYLYQKGQKEFENLYFIDPSPHSKIYKTSLIKDLTFPKKVGYTDNLLFYYAMAKAKKVVYSDKAYAYYLINREGNTMTDVRPQVIDAHVTVFSKIINEVNNIDSKDDIFYYRMFESYKFMLNYIPRVNGSVEEKASKANEIYKIVELLKPHKASIIRYYDIYAKTGRNERIKDKLLFGPLSKVIYKRNINKLLKGNNN